MWILAGAAYSQVPGITYQAVIMDSQVLPGEDNRNSPLVEKEICLKFVFKNPSGVSEYEEVISTTTDAFGMVNVIIGTGRRTGGTANTFSQIVWNAQAKFLEVSFDKSGSCSTFVLLSSQQFTAVPFALYSTNSGTPGPVGPVGPQGATGLTGAVGPIGPVGNTGSSAYQVAVAAGFVGTEAQWLASLQGVAGAPGPQGIQGIAGTNGTNGTNGANGVSAYQQWLNLGNTGSQADFISALRGAPGAAGATGPQGVRGTDGAAGPQGAYKEISNSDAAVCMSYANKVIIVPGYGLAVAQAQHVCHELEKLLEDKGVDVKYAIHPVAGRMPGHMNVLLAEADVSYDKLIEMEEANDEFKSTDVVLILGANDVVNPAAKTDPASPIYGMPILEVEQAKTVIVNKRSMKPGYAGIENELFFQPKTSMLFGDAKAALQKLVAEIKSL